MIKTTITALCASAMISTVSHAASVFINNHSFEDGIVPAPGGWSTSAPDGWTQPSGTSGIQNVSGGSETGIDGSIIAFLQGGALQQDLATTIASTVAIGDQFQLTLAATNQNGSPTFDFDIQNSSGVSLIGGAVTSSPASPANPTYADIVVNGTVDTASTEVFLVLSNSAGQTRIDNVRLDYVSAVPEPSSAALLGLGGIALILRRKK